MTVTELHEELNKIITGLNTSGFCTVKDGICEKLKALHTAAGEIGLKKGKHLIENLLEAIIAIREGKSGEESGKVRLTALEFYMKTMLSDNETEEI